MISPQDSRMERYRSSLVRAWDLVDYSDWPVKLSSVFHLFLPHFSQEFRRDLRALKNERGMSARDIARGFGTPSRIYRLIDSVIYGMRRERMPLEEQRAVVEELLDLVKALKHGSEFNEDGRNEILSPAESFALAELVAERPCSLSDAALCQRLCGLIWASAESMYFRCHCVAKEIHGPYPARGKVAQILVRDYANLQPSELWPGKPVLPFGRLRVVVGYREPVKLSIDPLNHLSNDGQQSPTNIWGVRLWLDGQEVDVREASGMMPAIENTITTLGAAVDAMNWHERVEAYAAIFWYRKRPLADALGLPWEVPDAVRQIVSSGSVDERRVPKLTGEQVSRLARLTI